MYVIFGATGHVGSVIANKLLLQGEKIRVLGRKVETLSALANKGAEAFSVDVMDRVSLAEPLSGARAAFLMIPPSLTSEDYRRDQEIMGESIAAAVEKSKLQYAVVLSSIGAQAPSGTGPIAGLHSLEEKLNRISSLNVLYLRAGFFMENHLMAIPTIKIMGVLGTGWRPDVPVPQIAARDIGEYAAQRLLNLDFAGKQIRELLGPRDVTLQESTVIIGKAIGKPDLPYVQFSYDQVQQALTSMGVPAKSAASLVEMYRGANEGLVVHQEPRSPVNTTPTSLETFVQEVFVPAYRGKSATA
jgi:uncharacterized protein YbjT (DUF2867 family)